MCVRALRPAHEVVLVNHKNSAEYEKDMEIFQASIEFVKGAKDSEGW